MNIHLKRKGTKDRLMQLVNKLNASRPAGLSIKSKTTGMKS